LQHTPSVVSFFKELGEAVDLPLVIFQYPQSSGCAYSIEVLNALSELPHVVAIKAAPGTMEAYKPTWDSLRNKMSVLAAWDGPLLVEKLEYGAHGALIGISNIEPSLWADLIEATAAHDVDRTRELFSRCAPIMSSVWENHKPTRITSEVSATKEALVQMGLFPSSRVRPPLLEVTNLVRAEIRVGLVEAGLVHDNQASSGTKVSSQAA
jgi:4-hydroxy-tetrahydrodipicolinate synthase